MAGSEAEGVVVNDLIQRLIHGFTELLLLEFQLSRNFAILFLDSIFHTVSIAS